MIVRALHDLTHRVPGVPKHTDRDAIRAENEARTAEVKARHEARHKARTGKVRARHETWAARARHERRAK